jgi:hypothetical protein
MDTITDVFYYLVTNYHLPDGNILKFLVTVHFTFKNLSFLT